MSDEDVPEYQNWPASQEEREAIARDVFGRYLVISYDSWLSTAHEMLHEELRTVAADVRDEQMYDWLSRLPEADRENAFAFVRYISNGVVFSIMNNIDGTSGSLVGGNNAKTGFDYCDYSDSLGIQLQIDETTYEHGAEDRLIETVPVTQRSEERREELHDSWFEWLEKYSRWK